MAHANLRAVTRPTSSINVLCQARSHSGAPNSLFNSFIAQLLSTSFEHFAKLGQFVGGQAVIVEQMFEQHERVAAKHAFGEFAQSTAAGITSRAARKINVAATLGPMFEPAGLFELLHHRKYGGVSQLPFTVQPVANLAHRGLAQFSHDLHYGGLQVTQIV
jgi:hypothetical protein